MPKAKDYRVHRVFDAGTGLGAPPQAPRNGTAQDGMEQRSAADVDIKLVELLGVDARFPDTRRTLVLSRALGRGIDEWVFASADAIKRMLLAGASTATGGFSRDAMLVFFEFLTVGGTPAGVAPTRPTRPSELSPVHVQQFVSWLKTKGKVEGRSSHSTRRTYQAVKATILEMFALRIVPGDSHRFFKRGVFCRDLESHFTGMSDAEQARLAAAIKADLSAIHHDRLKVTMRELQALRLIVVAHRMGHNTTPLLELGRDSTKPGLLPGTILVQTVKHRSRTEKWLRKSEQVR